eukprot:scaffold13126_cov175-Amphora_coffeaeformis.AAC.4
MANAKSFSRNNKQFTTVTTTTLMTMMMMAASPSTNNYNNKENESRKDTLSTYTMVLLLETNLFLYVGATGFDSKSSWIMHRFLTMIT